MANPLNTIPPKQRGIIYLLLTIVAIVATWFIVKETRAFIRRNKERKDPQVVVTESQTEYDDAVVQGESLSKPQSDYKASANAIEKLLDGCESAGSELNVIENIITVVKKPIDWAYLKTQFGVREISQCGSFGQIKDSYDLPTLLKDQLDSAGFYTINIDGYSKTGWAFETINILRDYLKAVNVSI